MCSGLLALPLEETTRYKLQVSSRFNQQDVGIVTPLVAEKWEEVPGLMHPRGCTSPQRSHPEPVRPGNVGGRAAFSQ